MSSWTTATEIPGTPVLRMALVTNPVRRASAVSTSASVIWGFGAGGGLGAAAAPVTPVAANTTAAPAAPSTRSVGMASLSRRTGDPALSEFRQAADSCSARTLAFQSPLIARQPSSVSPSRQ